MRIRKLISVAMLAAALGLGLPAQASDRIDINHATVEQLQSVKGIGEKTAQAIVAYRREHGGFKDVDELTKVRGIGERKLEKIRDQLTVKDEAEKGHGHED